MTATYPTAFRTTSFLYALLAFASTYSLRATQDDEPRLYYISGLLNSAHDEPSEFAVRWALWLALVPFVFLNLRPHLPPAWAAPVPAAWLLAIVTGVDFRVFGGPEPTDALVYAHYGATALVMLTSSLTLGALGLARSAAFWLLVSAAYATLFFVRRFVDDFEMPSEIFMVTEYVFYVYFTAALSFFV